ncbi:major facilitator superfamily domain-containing protein [Pavlovales sp. CCMP2436]|nr:major facilitator superfamily domain-containing protein [Pavlovales sp. CCMP2436]
MASKRHDQALMQAQPAISLVNAQRQPEAQVVQAQPPPGPFGTGFRAPPPVLRRNPSASVVLAVRRAERDGESAGGGDAPASRRGRRCCGADLRGMPSPLLIIICALGDATYTALSPFFPQAAATAGLSATATGVVFSCGMWAGVLVTPTFAVAFTLRLVQGGVAAIYEVPPARVAAALGLQEAARGVGLMIGPSAGGLLFSLGGFPLPFIICSAALFILGMAVAVFLPPDPAQANEVGAKMVTFGELLYLPAVGAIILLMTALSAALTAPDPVLGPYAEERFGLNPAQIGLLFSSCTIAYALLSPVIGEIGGR